MKTNILNRLISNFEKDITWLGKKRLNEYVEPYKPISVVKKDSDETKKLIIQHNAKVKEYNRNSETLALMWIHKTDQTKAQPQDDCLGALDYLLQVRYLKKHRRKAFRFINSNMHALEQKMIQLSEGKDGIEALQKRITKSRKA